MLNDEYKFESEYKGDTNYSLFKRMYKKFYKLKVRLKYASAHLLK